VKGPAQLAELAKAPLLGIVPRIRGEAREPQATVDKPMSPEAEAYRALRTALRFIDVEAPLQTVLITSAGPAEGKTTTATHFAIALAQSGERVVLVDADLRRGSLLESFSLPSGGGITSVVTGAAHLEDVLLEWRDLLMVVGTGPLPPNPAEILGSTAMASLLEELQAYADIVVIDAPPVLPVTDAVALSTQVDGVVLVGRDGKSTRTNIAESRRRLEGVGAHVVGCVLNGVRTKGELYADYRYLSPAVETPTLGRRLTDRLRH
jgi:polysaccharide biosynthesis transport protein